MIETATPIMNAESNNAPIDTGDEVLHIPTGEAWVVAYVENGRLACCGWPYSLAELSDCRLTEKATPERRQKLLEDLARMSGDDPRKSYAVRVLADQAMAKALTNEQLAEIEFRLNAITPGPWKEQDQYIGKEGLVMVEGGDRIICTFCDMENCDDQDLVDARFIAHAPTDMAALVAEVRRLQALLNLPTADMIVMEVANREGWTSGVIYEAS